jgi:UDP:flavonoid glycosyltransferase YjiC (YdhE family)
MPENAARVAWAGAGVALPRRLVTAGGIRLAVRRVVGDPAFGARAREMRDWAAANDGAANAADAVEALAAGHRAAVAPSGDGTYPAPS